MRPHDPAGPADPADPARANQADRVRVRTALGEDAAACARIMRESRAAAMPWLPVLHTPAEDLAFLASLLADTPAWVAELDGAVSGFAALDPAAGTLEHLYLDPALRRRGIGSSLLARARTAYDGPVELWVFEDNHAARAFYAAHGGIELYRTDGTDNEERTPDVRVRLPAAAVSGADEHDRGVEGDLEAQ